MRHIQVLLLAAGLLLVVYTQRLETITLQQQAATLHAMSLRSAGGIYVTPLPEPPAQPVPQVAPAPPVHGTNPADMGRAVVTI